MRFIQYFNRDELIEYFRKMEALMAAWRVISPDKYEITNMAQLMARELAADMPESARARCQRVYGITDRLLQAVGNDKRKTTGERRLIVEDARRKFRRSIIDRHFPPYNPKKEV